MKQIISILLCLLFSIAFSALESPLTYYQGETVTFTFTYPDESAVPKNLVLHYARSSDGGDVQFPSCTKAAEKVICEKVKIETEETNVSVMNTDTPTPVEIFKLTTKSGQGMKTISPLVAYKGGETEVTFTFDLSYDLEPLIEVTDAQNKLVNPKGKCVFASLSAVVTCTYLFTTVGQHKIQYNKVKIDAPTVINVFALPTTISPTKYYKDETVEFIFTYGDANDIPSNKALVYGATAFGTSPCEVSGAVLSCKNVHVTTDEENTQVTNSDTPKLNIFKLTTIKGQSLKTVSPMTIAKSVDTDITFTFQLEYDLLPTIEVLNQGGTAIAVKVACQFVELPPGPYFSVKCKYNFDTNGEYSIKYNKIAETVKKITVQDTVDPPTPGEEPTVSPGIYYKGETVDFLFTYPAAKDIPTNKNLKYGNTDTAFGNQPCEATDKVLKCSAVMVDTDQTDTQVTNSDTPVVNIFKLTTRTGQSLASTDISKIATNAKTEVQFTFAENYDLAPKITATLAAATGTVEDCALSASPGKIAKCKVTLIGAGEYALKINEVNSAKKLTAFAPVEPTSTSPATYYKGETVIFKFTYVNADVVPANTELVYGATPTAFGTSCTKSGAVLTCAGVKVSTDESETQVKNKATPTPINIFKLTTTTGQDLSALDPVTMVKATATDITFTFLKDYDLTPTIQAKSTDATKDPASCEMVSGNAKQVKCSFNIDKEATYKIVYNGVETTKELEVTKGCYLMLSFSFLILAYLF